MPGRRNDDFKVGLAVEGGGLRGVVSAAMLNALEDLGYSDAFDDIYACSSGAINSAFFIAGQVWYPLSIYFDDLTTGEFLDFRRVLRGRGPMSLDYVFNSVLVDSKPLDAGKIIDGPQRLHVLVTDADHIETIDACRFDSPQDLHSALQATSWLPLAIRGTARFRGNRAVDGGVLQLHPFRAAIADGCTHVLSLSTKPIAPPRSDPSWEDRIAAAYMNRLRPGLGTEFMVSLRRYLTVDRPYLTRCRLAPEERPAVLDIAPLRSTPEVKRHEVDRGRLIEGARTGYRAAHIALEQEDAAVVPRLTVYRRNGRSI